jgi:alanine dehydrogenase
MVLVLSAEEVAPLLGMATAIEVTEQAFLEQGQGLAVLHGQYALPMTAERAQDESGAFTGSRLRVTSGGLLGSGKVGLQCTAAGVGSAVALLYDCTDGLLAIIGGGGFGMLRTGATIALAAKYLAREDATRVGLIGTGRNALTLLEGVACVRPISAVKVYSRSKEHRRAFVQRASTALNREVQPVDSPRDAVQGAEILLVSTNAREPVFDPHWLEPGVYVGSMGRITELDRELFKMADVLVVSSVEQERTRYYNPFEPVPLEEMIEQGELRADKVVELGDVIAGKMPGRSQMEDTAVFHESQGGFGGVALAAAAYAEARRQGLGLEVAL